VLHRAVISDDYSGVSDGTTTNFAEGGGSRLVLAAENVTWFVTIGCGMGASFEWVNSQHESGGQRHFRRS